MTTRRWTERRPLSIRQNCKAISTGFDQCRFVKGVGELSVGTIGGSHIQNLTHGHHVAPPVLQSTGSHSHSVNAHNHKYANFDSGNKNNCCTYASNGTSTKKWFFKKEWYAAGIPDNESCYWAIEPGLDVGGGFYTADGTSSTNSKGSHTHTATQADTESALGDVSVQPEHIGLLPLMRL